MPATHEIVPDRIVAGTFAFAAAMTQGDVRIRRGRIEHLEVALDKLVAAGAEIDPIPDGFRVAVHDRPDAGRKS